ncbi:ribosome assembly RNA-binding protein YhbY [Thiomicrorhabdus lithotrophica]|uniref:Ribosome assembly RNA-binding protein YhbY n=1 Tax=Thiomicrorhabdus lithotrophica TaxID=2949997 RepID=A0ABY8CB44_9GAMM|nr:ribosome assembly RNA-binding protein YhbY [Thiomicrorhabdus lithotrophica]WEJ61905.1 ribosome assembly RNA-binding protein YhbY [Thiomicrorhabdus lithotrophica]
MSQPEKLTTNQKKYLRGIAHGLNPMIIIGANGVTESLMAELESTLEHHEILKIKMASADRDDRKQIVDYILEQTGALLVQTIGKICVIYRQSEETELPLPK